MKFLLGLLFITSIAHAEPKVLVSVDRNELSVGDTLTVTVSVTSEKELESQEPKTPELDGFELINAWSGRSNSSRMAFVNGKSQFMTEIRFDYNYMLVAKAEGKKTIDPFETIADGKTFKTQAIQINVLPAGSTPKPTKRQPPRGRPNFPGFDSEDEDPFGAGGNGAPEEDVFEQLLKQREQLLNQFNQQYQQQGPGANAPNRPSSKSFEGINTKEAFFMLTDVDKKEVYEGEQVTVTWYVYTRGRMLTFDRIKFPNLKGFWKEIIEEVPSLKFESEIVNGVPYQRALIASHALFPIKAGKATIDEFKVRSKVQLSEGFNTKAYEYTKSTRAIQINVKPLPLEGRLSNFSGAVGDFSVRAYMDNNQASLNQPFSLKIRFEGTGNAKLIELPALNFPAQFETYDTKSDSKFFKNGTSYKEFEVVLVPRQKGTFEIPPLSFSYFNPATGKYEQKTSEALSIQVNEGVASAPGADNRLQVKTEKELVKQPKTLLPVNEVDSLQWTMDRSSRLNVYLLFLLVALLGLGGKAYWEFTPRKNTVLIEKLVEPKLRQAEKLYKAEKFKESALEMTNAYYVLLGQLSGLGGAHTEFRELLRAIPANIRQDFEFEIVKSFDYFQFVAFAPKEVFISQFDAQKMQAEIKSSEALIARMAKAFDQSQKV